jgi:hypothetical protein
MDFEHADPQTYVNECSNSIFALLKREYDTPRNRALSATSRLKAVPALMELGRRNLTKPVELYAQLAIASTRSIDSLFKDSMMAALAKGLSPAEMNDLVTARDAAIQSIQAYADWLERRLPAMPTFAPMGDANYNYLLKHVYLLPLDAKQVEMLHEGIPGHFLQLSIANHLMDEIRRQHGDGIIIEGWALYTEEMLMRTGLYPIDSASQGQILRLSRYRAARIGVDVNLHTGRWTFEQAVKYFMEAGGLDREAAEGEAAGAAASPTQKITYITGTWADHAAAG